MYVQKRTAFSPDNLYFACISSDEKLLIWEIASSKFIDCKFHSSDNTCSSLHWISPRHHTNSSKKAKISSSYSEECNLLAVGTVKGDILIYNVVSRNLFLHLVGRHSDAVNDMSFYQETDSFFTCSSDNYIGISDISSWKQISKWAPDDSPVSSICIIDDNNMLSSSASILWWNISEKTVIKKFIGHSAEIFKLLPVNAVSLNCCYFLSAADRDTKINAWSLTSFQSAVASFLLPLQPKDMDISKVSSKDKPLMLSAVTQDGCLHLFEHALNGNVSKPIEPAVSIKINPEPTDVSFISVKLTSDSESCIVAFGSSETNIIFKHLKIKDILRKSKLESNFVPNIRSVELSMVNDNANISKVEIRPLVNGHRSLSPSVSSSEVINLKSTESVISSYKKKLRSSSISPLTVISNCNLKENATKNHKNLKQVEFNHPKNTVDSLLEALEARNESILEIIFQNNDAEFISGCVKNLPSSNLKVVLTEINHRLHQKYSSASCIWLKEILRIHLRYLVQSQDTVEILNLCKKYLDSMNIHQTIHKMTVLNGLLSLQMQNSSSDENESDNEEIMQ